MPRFIATARLDELPYNQPRRRDRFDKFMLLLFVVLCIFAAVAVAGLIMALV
jgi:Tfp pilus assembly protein PilN